MGIDEDRFGRSRARFEEVIGFLNGEGASVLRHSDLEERLATEGRELLRLLYQDHLDLRAEREPRLEQVVDAQGVDRPSVEAGHTRTLTTIFGGVTVTRLAYRHRGQANLHPADGGLNLPQERHSHGLRQLAAVEPSRGSFDDAVEAIRQATGRQLGKRQVEELAQRAAIDFDDFYASQPRPPAQDDDVVVLSADGSRPAASRSSASRCSSTTSARVTCRPTGPRPSWPPELTADHLARRATAGDRRRSPTTCPNTLGGTRMERREINPTDWLSGFNINHGIEVTGAQRVLYLSGQTSNAKDGTPLHPGDLVSQFRTAWSNLNDALTEAGMDPTNIVRLNLYTTDVPGFMAKAGELVPIFAGDGCKPVATLLGVTALFEPEIMVEIEATAVA